MVKGLLAKRILAVFCALLALLLAAAAFLAPFPGRYGTAHQERYLCVWEDGSDTKESYYSAYPLLQGMSKSGNVLLSRGGMLGEVGASEPFRAAVEIFERGSLKQLYAFDAQGILPLEHACLWRTYKERIYYAGGAFRWTGERVASAEGTGKELVLLEGSVSSTVLKRTGVEKLILRKDAQFSARTILGTNVKSIEAQAPYSALSGGVYLDTVGGKRLLAIIADCETLEIEDCDFIEAGALLLCKSLRSLSLPFVGSAKTDNLTGYKGELSYLFQNGESSRVPQTLNYVAVSGGYLIDFAFYGCSGLEEINACGVKSEDISSMAFHGLDALRRLHTPRESVLLTGEFISYPAPCGCWIYERVHG